METASRILYPTPPVESTSQGYCCVCGWHGQTHPKSSIFSKSTGAASALAPIPTDRICVHCAALWAEPKTFSRSILATAQKVQFPMIAPDPCMQRPTWKEALNSLDIAAPRVCILTTDPKKRVWPFAQISQGDRFSLYLHDPSRGVSGNRVISLRKWLDILEEITRLYQLGFSKYAIEQGLLGDLKRARACGLTESISYERRLQQLRLAPEFLPALIIAQKEA